MAQLGMTPEEYDYWVENLSEAFKLIGQDALLYQVDTQSKDFYYDPELTHKEPVKIGVIFEENPRPILKKYNWMVEEEDLPYVCYLCSKDENLQPIDVKENMIIDVPSKYGLQTVRRFLITHIRGNSIDPLAWICRLTPYRPKVDFNPETVDIEHSVKEVNDTGFSYLKR